jgi:NADH-quinone oxidoreductase subunit C
VSVTVESLAAAFPDAAETGVSADGIPFVRLASVAEVTATVQRVRGELGHSRLVDVTAVDRLRREDRFELQYLFYSMDDSTWLRLKARTDGEAPSITPLVPGANWYEREVFDLFGITFVDHPDLRRIMLPDDWAGYPLRRSEPLGSEPVDFTVTRKVYGTA